MKHLLQRQRAQRGVTLIITLVMLVLITLVSVSTIRTSTMDEKMAGGARDRDKAFQAAEAAVQLCLAQLQTDPSVVTALAPATAANTPNWEVAANWSNANSVVKTVDATGLASQPRCMYEALGAGTGSYRVTGRAEGGSSRTEVMLQATYSAE
jgi:type IV pilus assembly protein PilX